MDILIWYCTKTIPVVVSQRLVVMWNMKVYQGFFCIPPHWSLLVYLVLQMAIFTRVWSVPLCIRPLESIGSISCIFSKYWHISLYNIFQKALLILSKVFQYWEAVRLRVTVTSDRFLVFKKMAARCEIGITIVFLSLNFFK